MQRPNDVLLRIHGVPRKLQRMPTSEQDDSLVAAMVVAVAMGRVSIVFCWDIRCKRKDSDGTMADLPAKDFYQTIDVFSALTETSSSFQKQLVWVWAPFSISFIAVLRLWTYTVLIIDLPSRGAWLKRTERKIQCKERREWSIEYC